MGNRNFLHVCQHCGIVHATSSSTGPRRCAVCAAVTFSEYDLNDLVRERLRLPAEPVGVGVPLPAARSSD